MNKEFPFIGGAYTARSQNLNAQECENFYVETDQTGGKNIIALVGVPGMKEWLDIGYFGEVRNMIVWGSNLYVGIKDRIYEIDSSLTATNLGTIGTVNGWLDFTAGENYLSVFDATGGWYITGGVLTQIIDADFVTPGSGTYQDLYHIVSEADSNKFWFADTDALGDNPVNWDATNYYTAEGDSDNILAIRSVQRQLWIIGERTTELWYNRGGDTLDFARNPGGFFRIGCNAKRSIATWEDNLLFLDNNNRIVRKNGLRLEPVSTYQIDYLISTFSNVSDATGFIYSQEGHVFYELSFSSANKTICYDLITGFWHTRSSTAQRTRSYANCTARFNNKVLVGDYQNGKIYELDFDTFTDNGDDKVAVRACQYLNDSNNQLFVTSFELDIETGVGNDDVTTPQIALEVSKDGGHTWTQRKWTTEKWKNIGSIGQYGNRVKWYRLGYGRNWMFRVMIADAVKRFINKAYIDVIRGNG